MQAAEANPLAPSYCVRTNGNIETSPWGGIAMRAVGVVSCCNNGERPELWNEVLYVVNYLLNVRCSICIDPFNILRARKVGQDDASIFLDNLYNSGYVFESDSASHTVPPEKLRVYR